MLCDCCNDPYHMFCLKKPLKKIPRGKWYCDSCCLVDQNRSLLYFLRQRKEKRSVGNLESGTDGLESFPQGSQRKQKREILKGRSLFGESQKPKNQNQARKSKENINSFS
uniref:PHD-type domain-containing protein n=1 Tax=Arcella intermedia TaxID=1963864 RepID=A0A6B2LS72_9EUKA